MTLFLARLATRPTAVAACLSALAFSLPASAFDARSIALGGASIANGRGVHGAAENPAALAAMQRREERVHLLIGGAVDARDHAGLYEIAQDDDNMDLIDDLDDEIERLSGSTLTCDPVLDDDDTVCLSGTARLGALSADGLDVFNDVDGEPVDGYGIVRGGIAVTGAFVPFALYGGGRGAIKGRVDVDQSDRDYVQGFVDALSDDELTRGEIRENARFAINGNTIELAAPEDIIESTGDAAGLYRTQFAVALATSVAFGKQALDIGVSPKLSRLTAYGLQVRFADAFDDDAASIADQIEDTEVEETSFTFDIGMATDLATIPVRVAAVLRNVVPESIETDTGFEFETTPQLIVGAHHQRGLASFTADIALNSAQVDGIETQPLAVGIEFGTTLLKLRAGLGADLGREEDKVALSAGFKLGPLEIGGRLSGVESGRFGALLAFTF